VFVRPATAGRLVRDAQQFAAEPLQRIDGEPTGGYRAVGDAAAGERGRLLVVLPGLVGPADAVASLAAELGSSWRVCAVTYPRAESVEALLAWLERLRRREGGGAASVYGGSFGALVAQAWLRAHPDGIADLVLSGAGPPDAARAARNRRALRWMGRAPMPLWRAVLRLAVWLATGRAADRDYWRRFYGAAIGEMTWPDLESRYRIAIGVDEGGPPGPDVLVRWCGRMLALEGSRDRVARSTAREALRATYRRAQFHTFEGAGHAPALERPEAWLAVVAGFLRARDDAIGT
jgi:pimeloyl-ACP methyl ester carboxylesterase